MGVPVYMNEQKHKRLPHHDLLIAVVCRSIKDYLNREHNEYGTAKQFLFPDCGNPGVDIYCEWLNICPDRLRRSLKRHHDSGTRWQSLMGDEE